MKRKKYTVIVNVNLEYQFNAKSFKEAKEMVENVELPKEYVSESFEIVKITNRKGKEYYV